MMGRKRLCALNKRAGLSNIATGLNLINNDERYDKKFVSNRPLGMPLYFLSLWTIFIEHYNFFYM